MTIRNSDPTTIAKIYLAAWNEADEFRRRELLDQGWAADARYVDPLMHGDGLEGIARMIGNARTQFPGHEFALSGMPDGHGVYVRFSWTLASTNGAAVAGGTDLVRLNDQGRIAEVVGFLDRGAP